MIRLLSLFFIFIMIVTPIPALAETGTVTINGTNVSTAQANTVIVGAPQSITITAWSVGGIKTFKVNVTNASDTITFNIYNVTAAQVNELKINGSGINGYQADSNGLITITRTQTTGNHTYNIAPAVSQGGFSTAWAWVQNLYVQTTTTIYNVSVYNATNIQGDGSGLYNINSENITSLGRGINVSSQPVIITNVSLIQGTNISLTQSGSNITIASLFGTTTVSTQTFTATGSERNYTLTANYIANSSRVYVNGLRQPLNATSGSYTESVSTKSINFTSNPRNGDKIEVEYDQS